jgi:hypothetical protein
MYRLYEFLVIIEGVLIKRCIEGESKFGYRIVFESTISYFMIHVPIFHETSTQNDRMSWRRCAKTYIEKKLVLESTKNRDSFTDSKYSDRGTEPEK